MARTNRKAAQAVSQAGVSDAPANPAGDDAGANTSESGSTSGDGIGRTPATGDDALDADVAAAVARRLAALTPATADPSHVANWSHLRVRARRPPGIRRAGRFWPFGEVVTVFADSFTDHQIEALLTEPALEVIPVARENAQ